MLFFFKLPIFSQQFLQNFQSFDPKNHQNTDIFFCLLSPFLSQNIMFSALLMSDFSIFWFFYYNVFPETLCFGSHKNAIKWRDFIVFQSFRVSERCSILCCSAFCSSEQTLNFQRQEVSFSNLKVYLNPFQTKNAKKTRASRRVARLASRLAGFRLRWADFVVKFRLTTWFLQTFCTLQCVMGCQCNSGFFRRTSDNRCVEQKDCNVAANETIPIPPPG